MQIKIFGAESLGVRGLSCSVDIRGRKVFIDPGMGLGWSRHGLLPHPFQIAIGARIRDEIVEELQGTRDLVFSHFDGDHCPLLKPNPYQLGIAAVREALSSCRIWAKGPDRSPQTQQARRQDLAVALGRELGEAEGKEDGPLAFSFPVPHGERGAERHMLMMTRIEDQGECFVHASDIQFLDDGVIDAILDWKPKTVLASGPPLYRYENGGSQQRAQAWRNARRLAAEVDLLIVDHHLFRSEEGLDWLEALQRESSRKVFSAAAFMRRAPLLLEAWRQALYDWLPVEKDWHEWYRQGLVDAEDYRLAGWEALIAKGKIQPCKWYLCCPIKAYTDQGRLPRNWIENYCLLGNKSCIRYHMEERGEPHPDHMLPDGEFMNT